MTTIEILKKARELLQSGMDIADVFLVLPVEQVYKLADYVSVSSLLEAQNPAIIQRFNEVIARLEAAG